MATGLLAAAAMVLPAGAVQPTDVPMLALSVAAFAALLAAGTRPWGRPEARPWRVAVAAHAVLAALAAACVFSSQRWTALLGAPGSSLGLVQAAALVAVALFAAGARTRVREALTFVAPWALALECAIAVAQLASVESPGGTTSNSTFLSQVVLLLLPATLMPALSPAKVPASGARAARLGVAGLALLTLLLSGSRVGFAVGLAAAGACVLVARGRAAPRALPSRARLGGASVAVLTAAASPVALLLLAPPERLESALASRPHLWASALRLLRGSPVLGAGPDGFRVGIAPEASARMSVIEGGVESTFGALAADPHNVVLAVLASGGVAVLLLVGWLLYEVFRNWAAQSVAGRLDAGAVIATTAFAATTVLAPAPLQTALLAAAVAGSSLLPERAPAKAAASRAVRALTDRAVWALGLAAALLLGAHAVTRLVVGPVEYGTLDAADAIRAQRAADVWRVDPFLHFWAARMWMFVGLERGVPAAAGSAARAADRAVELEPANPFYAHESALALDLFDGGEAATVERYQRAVELFPNWAECRLGFARYLLKRDRPLEAVVHALAGVALAPDSADAHELAASALEGVDRGDEARAHRETAISIRAREDGG